MNPTTNYLTQGQYRAAKTRLTRAVNSGDPQRIIDTVDAHFCEWDDGDYAWPDDWARWERARLDAEMALATANW
jgi:hypothetical protein